MYQAPSFFQGISFQLARIGVLIAFALGFLLSSVQIYLDYRAHERELEKNLQRIVEMATPTLIRAVHTLHSDLAAEVVDGLLAYDFIYRASIIDDKGEVLAQGESSRLPSGTRWLTQYLGQNTREYQSDVQLNGRAQGAGTLRFSVDRDQALGNFYQRAQRSLLTGLLRDMALVLLLFLAFYMTLTKPLVRLAGEIRMIRPDKPGVKRLTPLPGRKDELAELVDGSNQLLDMVELLLAKRRAGELALRKSEEHLRQIIDSLPVIVGARNAAGRYLFANQALADVLGCNPEDIRGRHARDVLGWATPDVEPLLRHDQRVVSQRLDIRIAEEAFTRNDGEQRFYQTHIMPLEFYDETVALVVSVDITERKKAQAKMEHMAHHDALTNLPNRIQLVERLDLEVSRAERQGYCGAVLFIDLDQFKNINDSLGHPVGDQVLKEVANRLVASVRKDDLVARLGGDEFVLVLTLLDKDMNLAALKAGEISEKIRRVLARPYYLDDLELHVTGSVGVVMYPDKNSRVHELLRFADTAMYQVKEKGRDSIEFFNEQMADKVSRQLSMEGDLHRALETEQFELHFQPKIDLRTGALIGAEALLRWDHPEQGPISPVEFIPVLETSGLILDVGQWVLEQACDALTNWQAQGLWQGSMRLSINISPRQFRRNSFADDVIDTLARYEVPRGALELEVTEGIVIQQVQEAIVTMNRLAEQGVSFSLDDFGTGYSSISYLKQLPVSVLKIDQSFICDIVDDRNDRILVETMITMGKLLDLEVIAEGVEDQAQVDLLRTYGCHYYQGFYASAAVNRSAFDALLRKEAGYLDESSSA